MQQERLFVYPFFLAIIYGRNGKASQKARVPIIEREAGQIHLWLFFRFAARQPKWTLRRKYLVFATALCFPFFRRHYRETEGLFHCSKG